MSGDGLLLSHGAGSDRNAPVLLAAEAAFVAAGLTVVRYDLPFRRERPHGPPRPGDATRDREGLRTAVSEMRARVPGRVFLGGHSYGGRQSSILAAAEPELADGLLLLSYPLHPPRRPAEMRTAHFPDLKTPAFFLHGTRDAFGSPEEMRAALRLIPARVELMLVAGGHDLRGFRGIGGQLAGAFLAFMRA